MLGQNKIQANFTSGLTKSRRWASFTLIELLVVIAIIAVLASLLLPSLERARDMAKRISCRSNLHQMYLGATMYYDDNDGWFARASEEAGTGPAGTDKANMLSPQWPSHRSSAPEPSGLYQLANQEYFAIETLHCPSMSYDRFIEGFKQRPHPTNLRKWGWPTNYDYRYNHHQATDNRCSPCTERPYPYRNGILSKSKYRQGVLFADASGLGMDGKGGSIVREGEFKWNHLKGGNLVTHTGTAYWLGNDHIGVGRWDYSGWPHWHRKTNFPAIHYLLQLKKN